MRAPRLIRAARNFSGLMQPSGATTPFTFTSPARIISAAMEAGRPIPGAILPTMSAVYVTRLPPLSPFTITFRPDAAGPLSLFCGIEPQTPQGQVIGDHFNPFDLHQAGAQKPGVLLLFDQVVNPGRYKCALYDDPFDILYIPGNGERLRMAHVTDPAHAEGFQKSIRLLSRPAFSTYSSFPSRNRGTMPVIM